MGQDVVLKMVNIRGYSSLWLCLLSPLAITLEPLHGAVPAGSMWGGLVRLLGEGEELVRSSSRDEILDHRGVR